MSVDIEYKKLVKTVLEDGVRKHNRTGIDTLSIFGYHYKLDLMDGFPMLTTKKIEWKNILLENLWFLSGHQDTEFLRHYDVKFWEPWVDEKGLVPSAYGYEWRHFDGGTNNDQIWKAIQSLRNTPNSRRIVINAWNPYTAPDSQLPPCHMMWVLNVQQRYGDQQLNLALFQRSCDIALGLPYNIAGYAFLQHLLAHLTSLQVGFFSHTLVDAHIYTKSTCGVNKEYDHVPRLRRQCARKPYPLPSLAIDSSIQCLGDVMDLIKTRPPLEELLSIFKLHSYQAGKPISFKVAV